MKSSALTQTVDVETPELAVLSYTVAGVGSRATAALIDYLICFASVILMIFGLAMLAHEKPKGLENSEMTTAWALAIMGVIQFVILWLYYVLFEALMDGQTPGKRFMKLRVVRDGGLAVNFEASAIRNLVRFMDMQPVFFYAVGMISVMANSRGKRLGDMVAGTLVVKEDVVTLPLGGRVESSRTERPLAVAPLTIAAKLNEDEYATLDRFVQRRMQLEPHRRSELAATIVTRLRAALDDNASQQPIAALVRLHEEEQAARARGIASRDDRGAARERHAIVAINAPRWNSFADQLKSVQSAGLKSLDEQGVRDFVQEYRDLTADLARLRTATKGTNSAELFYLNRLVASAHSLLYRRRTITLQRVLQFLFVDAPAEIRASARPIALASALLFVPVIITARSVVTKPALIDTLLPPAMVARADSGVANMKAGKTDYIKDPQMLRPVMASRIITNNVQVVFMAFASGVTAGILTVWVLVTNGISMGSVVGLYMSKGIGKIVFGFIAAHGVLELAAIVIAGGGGMLIAAAMLIPGNRTRRVALAENGRRSIRLVGGAAFLLVFAGTLEGFVSPNASIPIEAKFAISGATAVLLAMYLYKAPRFLSSRY